ncbi:YhcN/YlaJ family sporulation lipoprotein [Lederbergia lenta]|uniref:Sporulation lipoprotein YhcN/YlaJ n=1 Tax=Lederbergia lenta TaxID=1467 RepID=A0A2X4WCU7_LEDLE|nr:YhcN/YlaJ family sporulation lipoprotein [Lederbergia lenta]MEC2324148.1 YhcN/YlaJ family sporulation lipoprotein [Lederbergia lenta]SQI60549.1 sporulation lipoprotein YhcN/YlaJ [Lederbergia lenta]
MRKFSLIIMLLFILSACTQNNAEPNIQQNEVLPQGVSVKDSHINLNDNKNLSDEEKADHLVNLVASIPNVNNATAVVIGDFAMVGIDVDADLERSKVGSVKYSVVESLKHDPHGANAMVIADPDLYARLKEVGEDTRNGKPIEGIMNELSDIAGRLMPDVPPNESGKNPEDALKKPKKEMNPHNRQQLDKEQQEHSSE